jgi:selenocysteine lyase/cysteine desulfurase
MFYLRLAFSTKDYCNNIEAKRSVFYIMSCQKITCGPVQFGFFGSRDDRLGRLESFVCSGFYLDKDDSPLSIDHNLTAPAGKVAGQFPETFLFQKALAAFLTPSAELLSVSQ